MGKDSVAKLCLILLCVSFRDGDAQLNPQFGTIGNSYRLVRGHHIDNEERGAERSMVFHRCGEERSCSHVGRLQSSGDYIMITSQNELTNTADVSALWKKERPSLRNIALNKNTRSADAVYGKPASKAVDGHKGMKYFESHCFSAGNTVDAPWWRVDLGRAAIIDSVSVTNAGIEYEKMADSLKSFDIRIGLDDNRGANPLCRGNLTIAVATTVNFVCDKEMAGSYVFIEKQGNDLILCEVEVYGAFI